MFRLGASLAIFGCGQLFEIGEALFDLRQFVQDDDVCLLRIDTHRTRVAGNQGFDLAVFNCRYFAIHTLSVGQSNDHLDFYPSSNLSKLVGHRDQEVLDSEHPAKRGLLRELPGVDLSE